MANTFFGFSTDAFEQFVRAVCLHVFGPGVKAFGNGPDRGREAIFNGAVPYPFPPTQNWSGYGVIQAKCKEKSESSKVDQKWALKHLEYELNLFVDSEKRTPKPEYYVFVTNVELSSVERGWDAGEKLINSYYDKLPFKGHALWDANQLSAFLDTYTEIRKRFAAFLTPGDVLAQLLNDIERRTPNAVNILSTFLERELRADENSRLDQAGNRTEDQLRLARLFFDLPAFPEQRLEPPLESIDSNGKLPAGVLKELLVSGTRKLDSEAVFVEEARIEGGYLPSEVHQWYVLFGGPGSGKSTLGQILAQIHRASLLARRPQRTLLKASRDAIKEIRALCETDALPWPKTPRFPIRVELSRFARKLQETAGIQSFSEYIRNNVRGDHSFDHEDFREWLCAYPWLLILDGLDEVPTTSNRDAVISSVRNFLAEARQVDADLFIVATSRQQGYNGEFSESLTAYRHLAPLSNLRALNYVHRYAMAKYGDHQQVARDNLVEKLTEAADRELTRRLMTTPLQVTFMATVVSAQGEPGEDRWQLFEGYYRTIYDREKQKAVPPFNEVLSNHEGTIGRLHYDIGFALQYEGETAADSGVTLPLSKFERIVDKYLSDDGYDGEEKNRLVTLIVAAASQRLVFLTSRTKDELAFEVRSLQEFMAAERLTSGNEYLVEERLRAIAPIRYWRNVFLFAASKCFRDAKSRHLEGIPCALCEELTKVEAIWEITRAGPDLALDLLQSGAAARKPAHGRTLTRLAFELLTEPDVASESEGLASASQRLKQALQPSNEALYQELLGRFLGQSDPAMSAHAWLLILRLIPSEFLWATRLAERSWPKEVGKQVELLNLLPPSSTNYWLHEKITNVLPKLSVNDAMSIKGFLQFIEVKHEWLKSLNTYFLDRGDKYINFRITKTTPEGVGIRFTGCLNESKSKSALAVLSTIPWENAEWIPLSVAAAFLRDPSCKTLSAVLRECQMKKWYSKKSYFSILPWPLAACLFAAAEGQNLDHLCNSVENGELGDISEWKQAEERWERDGVTFEDLNMFSKDDLPFRKGIGLSGFPNFLSLVTIEHNTHPEELADTIATAAKTFPAGPGLRMAMFLLMFINSGSGKSVCRLSPNDFRDIMERLDKWRWACNGLGLHPKFCDMSNWLEFFDWFGRSDKFNMEKSGGGDFIWMPTWHRAFIEDPMKVGLLRLMASLAGVGPAVPEIPNQFLELSRFEDPRIEFAAILIRITWPILDAAEAVQIAADAARLLNPPAEENGESQLFWTVENHLDSVHALESFLIELHRIMPATVPFGRARCEQLLRKVVRRKPSKFKSEGVLERLDLPRLPHG